MGWIKRIRERLEQRTRIGDDLEALIKAFVPDGEVTRENALQIPAIVECVNVISNVIASLPIRLYRRIGEDIEEVLNDPRTGFLNDETGDLLTSYDMKKAWITDYLLDGNGYIYIQKKLNQVKGLYYVDQRCVSVDSNSDPIYKQSTIHVNGSNYRPFEFLRLVRDSKNGMDGVGIVKQNCELISAVYNAILLEKTLMKTGGNKRGFLKAVRKLEKDELVQLREAYNTLYNSNKTGVVVLNEGIDFKEASNTSVEMQLNESKAANSQEICKLFATPASIVDGTAKEEDVSLWIKICIAPLITLIESVLDRELLLECEKRPEAPEEGVFYFAFDTEELLRGDILKRYQAYQIAVDKNIMQIDEVRKKEDLPQLGLSFIRLGLDDVLYNPVTKEVYTPNTNKTTIIAKGGEMDESGNQE